MVPRSPSQAKGHLLAAVLESKDPVISMEPKILYLTAVEEVLEKSYTLPLSKAEVIKPGADLTIRGRLPPSQSPRQESSGLVNAYGTSI